MSDVIFNILFFVVIFCFLTYSVQWFGRTLRRYKEARRVFNEQNLRHTQPTSEFSVYTIENGRRTLINYRSEVPPMRVPAHIAMKDEMPPTYEVALTMEQPAVAPPPAFSAPAVALPRRSSATI